MKKIVLGILLGLAVACMAADPLYYVVSLSITNLSTNTAEWSSTTDNQAFAGDVDWVNIALSKTSVSTVTVYTAGSATRPKRTLLTYGSQTTNTTFYPRVNVHSNLGTVVGAQFTPFSLYNEGLVLEAVSQTNTTVNAAVTIGVKR